MIIEIKTAGILIKLNIWFNLFLKIYHSNCKEIELKTDTILIEKFSLSKETLEPKLFSLAYYFIAIVLLFSGISKIIEPENFLIVLNVTLGFLGENTFFLTATTLPVIEIALGLMLLLTIKRQEFLFAAVILFVSFLLFAVYGIIKGFNVNCGYFGSSVSNESGFWMIIRNIFFLMLSVAIYILTYKIGLNKSLTLNNIHNYI